MDMTVSPAYGKDYTTAKDAIAAWNSGKDFIIQDITHPYWSMFPVSKTFYVSKRDLTTETVYIRFNNNTKVCKVEGAS